MQVSPVCVSVCTDKINLKQNEIRLTYLIESVEKMFDKICLIMI